MIPPYKNSRMKSRARPASYPAFIIAIASLLVSKKIISYEISKNKSPAGLLLLGTSSAKGANAMPGKAVKKPGNKDTVPLFGLLKRFAIPLEAKHFCWGWRKRRSKFAR
jgi:hypothetical protein